MIECYECLFHLLALFRGHTRTAHSDDIQGPDLASRVWIGETEGGHVLGNDAEGTNHDEAADPGELVDADVTTQECIISNMDVAGTQGPVCHDDAVTKTAVVLPLLNLKSCRL